VSQPDDDLLARFVSVFARFDEGASVRRVSTAPAALADLYRHVPGPFPPLFERLLLTYRWNLVDLDLITLLANPVSEGLKGFRSEVVRDTGLTETLHPAGLAQFARPGDINYDPVCFVTSRRTRDMDCPIVRVDHEGLLVERRLRITAEVAPSFRTLVERVVARAQG